MKLSIDPEPTDSPPPVALPIEASQAVDGPPWTPKTFETAVFNFLLDHKQRLGVKAVSRCENVRVDGLIHLVDGSRLALEIKYAMNWAKACQACAQIALYQSQFAGELKLDGGIVVFERFSGDWARKKRKSSPAESGWSHWHLEHREAGGVRMDLLRLRDGMLESYPAAVAAADCPRSASGGRRAGRRPRSGTCDRAQAARPGRSP